MASEQILKNIENDHYEAVREMISTPLIRLDFDDQVCMRTCPNLKLFELLSIHPTADPCRFNNEECLLPEHHHEAQLYDKLIIKIFDLFQTTQKLPGSDSLEDKIIRTSIKLQLEDISNECDGNLRIMNYLEFLIKN